MQVCKYFLDAVEKNLYGFFWDCPNGDSCHYRHALPPGYILKKDKKKNDDENQEITMEEFIEVERKKLKGDLIPVTAESFAAWKKARKVSTYIYIYIAVAKKREKKTHAQEKKDIEAKDLREKKEAAIKAGKALAGIGISGRDLFTFKPELFVDDDEAGGADDYIRDAESGEDEEDDDDDDDVLFPLFFFFLLQVFTFLFQQNGEYLGNDEDEDEEEEIGGSSSGGIDVCGCMG